MPSLIRELRDRKVFRIGVAYLAGAWILMQVADVMFPALGLPAWSITLVAALLIIGFPVALLLAWAYQLTPEGVRRDGAATASTQAPAALPAPDARTGKAIAVLPFVDLSPDRDNEYFSDGLTEELLNVLAGSRDLRVASRTSCFTFKGKDADVPTVAERLKVTHVLEGSVRKAGSRIRITAQLIDAQSDSHLWSDTYDRELENIFEIQDDIARKIAGALRVRLDPREARGATTDSVEAYDLYLRGRGFHRRFSNNSLGFAIAMFEKATTVDPGFALAWCGAADSRSVRVTYHGSGPADLAAAADASARAIALAPGLAEAHVSRGLYHLAAEQHEDAMQDFARAIEIDPGAPEPRYQMARACIHRNDLAAAVDWFEGAMALSPDDFEIPLVAAPVFAGLGRPERAQELNAQGLANARRYLDVNPDSARAYYLGAGALLVLGQSREADEWAERALAIDPTDGSAQYNVACYYAQAGERDKAFACLERGGFHSLAWMRNDPDLAPLRADSRFAGILQRLEIAQTVAPGARGPARES